MFKEQEYRNTAPAVKILLISPLCLGFKGKTSQDVLDFLSNYSGEQLVLDMGPGLFPVVDGYVLKEKPEELYRRKEYHPVDLMLGFTADEGAQFVFNLLGGHCAKSVAQVKEILTMITTKMFFRGQPRALDVRDAVWQRYIGDETDLEALTKALVTLYGDLMFVAPSFNIAKQHSGKHLHII